jgi:hypothetical protein
MLLLLAKRILSVRRLASRGAIVVCLVFPASIVRAQRSIPEDNLAYPVLVQFPDGLASGFYINTITSTYLVTAKHVIFDPQSGNVRSGPMTLLSYPRDPKEPGTNIILVDMAALAKAGEIKRHPTADVAVVRVGEVVKSEPDKGSDKGPVMQALRFIPGVTVRTNAPSGLLGVSIDAIRKYDDILVANEVLLFGYPTSLGIQGSRQLDPLRPLLRRGIVAGLNPSTKSVIIDCPSYPGNSGGPVVEVDRTAFSATFKVIGVVSEFVPFAEKSVNFPIPYQNINISNSGYTTVTPMDFVLELIK